MEPVYSRLAKRFRVLDADLHHSILVYVNGTQFPPAISLDSIEDVRVFRSGGFVVQVSMSRYCAPDTTVDTVDTAWYEPCPETGALPKELWPETLPRGEPEYMVMHLRFKDAVPGTPNADAAVRYVFRAFPSGEAPSLEESFTEDFPEGENFLISPVPPFVSLTHRSYGLDYMGGVYEVQDDDMTAEDVALLSAKRMGLEVRYAPTRWVLGHGTCKHGSTRVRQAVAQLRARTREGRFPETHLCNELDLVTPVLVVNAGAGTGSGSAPPRSGVSFGGRGDDSDDGGDDVAALKALLSGLDV